MYNHHQWSNIRKIFPSIHIVCGGYIYIHKHTRIYMMKNFFFSQNVKNSIPRYFYDKKRDKYFEMIMT